MEDYKGPERTVRIPTTSDDWQLYDLRGSNLAAARLTRALKKAFMASTSKESIAIMSKALRADVKYGAMDTEPRAAAERCLNEVLAREFNYEGTLG